MSISMVIVGGAHVLWESNGCNHLHGMGKIVWQRTLTILS